MSSNTTASPFSALPCLQVIENKHYIYQLQKKKKKEKKTSLKTLKPLPIHAQNPKVKNLLQYDLLRVIFFIFYAFWSWHHVTNCLYPSGFFWAKYCNKRRALPQVPRPFCEKNWPYVATL
jgi:hypothetical protein